MIRFLTILALLWPLNLWAAPRQVTLFPDSALVEERVSVAPTAGPDGQEHTLILPGQADPATLRFGALPAASSIVDVRWTNRQEKNQAALAPLNARLKDLTANRDKLTADLEGVRGRLAFWKAQTKPMEQSVTALRELAAELGATLRQDTEKAQALERSLAEVNEDIERVQNEIAQVAGQARTVWDVRVLFAGPAPKDLEYAYTMADCGWTPVYRLDAQPAASRIDFSWQARVWQRSGQDWAEARLFLATMQPTTQTVPPDLPPWEIRPMNIMPRRAMAAPAMMEMKADMLAEAPTPAPQETRRATYAVWDMGRRALPAGETRTFEIERAAWPVTFTHLIRPSLDPKAFLQADAAFAQPKELPQGTGIFLVDGAMLDQREFSFAGREGTFFFGTNPLLTCDVTLLNKKTGEKGLFGQKQSFAWDWNLKIRNTASYPAAIRVEEPRPLIRDERIILTLTATPKPEVDPNPELLAWNATVPAGADSLFRVQVSLEAPDDLHIDPGWRW